MPIWKPAAPPFFCARTLRGWGVAMDMAWSIDGGYLVGTLSQDHERRVDATLQRLTTAVRQAGATITGDDRVSEEVAAMLIGVAYDTLRKWRGAGNVPDFYRLGGGISYRLRDVAAWLEMGRTTAAEAAEAAEQAAGAPVGKAGQKRAAAGGTLSR